MNADELAANPQATAWVVHDLNEQPELPFDDATFDAATCCVSVDYLVRPIEVFASVARVLRPGRRVRVHVLEPLFPTKAIAGWLATDDAGHVAIVEEYFRQAGGFAEPESRRCTPDERYFGDPLYAVWARVNAELSARNWARASAQRSRSPRIGAREEDAVDEVAVARLHRGRRPARARPPPRTCSRISSSTSSPICTHSPCFESRLRSSVQVAPAVEVEHLLVRGRRAVERDLLLRRARGRRHLFFGGAGDHEQRAADLEVGAGPARLREAALERGQRDVRGRSARW